MRLAKFASTICIQKKTFSLSVRVKTPTVLLESAGGEMHFE